MVGQYDVIYFKGTIKSFQIMSNMHVFNKNVKKLLTLYDAKIWCILLQLCNSDIYLPDNYFFYGSYAVEYYTV